MKGARAPDVGTATVDLGVIEGRDLITVPDPAGCGIENVDEATGDVVGMPGTVFGERLHGLPVVGALQGQNGLGDGVFLDVGGHCGDPLYEAVMSAARE